MLVKILIEECVYGDVYQMEQCLGYCVGKILKNFYIQGDDINDLKNICKYLGFKMYILFND